MRHANDLEVLAPRPCSTLRASVKRAIASMQAGLGEAESQGRACNSQVATDFESYCGRS